MNHPPKPYELTFDNRPHYLFVHIKADEANLKMALEGWQTIIDKCRELGVQRLLAEQVIPHSLSTGDMFTLATKVAAMQPIGIKIAFADPIVQNYEQNQFGELAASNRGVWARVFTTVSEAENWLMQGTTD